jgi:hypothetical protein
VFYIPLRNNLLPTPPPSAERFPTITSPLHIAALALSTLATLDWKKMFRGLNFEVYDLEIPAEKRQVATCEF